MYTRLCGMEYIEIHVELGDLVANPGSDLFFDGMASRHGPKIHSLLFSNKRLLRQANANGIRFLFY